MIEYTTAYHGTSSANLKKIKDKNRVYGWFDTEFDICTGYGYRKAEQDGSRPIVLEVKVPKRKFETNWLSLMQIRLGKGAMTATLSLSFSKYVVAIWRPTKNRWRRYKT